MEVAHLIWAKPCEKFGESNVMNYDYKVATT
jgi:hypothetical protein